MLATVALEAVPTILPIRLPVKDPVIEDPEIDIKFAAVPSILELAERLTPFKYAMVYFSCLYYKY
jgi:hypothetical protein